MTTTYLANVARGAAFAADFRADIGTVYRRALRHSRHVRFLRVGVLAGIAVVALTVAVANYMPSLGGFRLSGDLDKLVINGTKITMAGPRLTGFTSDLRPYQFIAAAARQDITSPDIVELQRIQAKIAMQDKSTVTMTADRGTYDMKADTMLLHDNIVLVSTTGYEAYLSQAVVDMHTGNVVSDEPVQVKLHTGMLNAKRLQVADNGAVLRFDGGVAMTVRQGENSTTADGQ